MEDETVQQTMGIARKADVALVGIGDLNESSYMVNLGWFSVQEMVEARIQQGVVGGLGVMIFTTSKGKYRTQK